MENITSSTSNLIVLPAGDVATNGDEDSYFCNGFILDLITEISRFPEIEVISSQTSFSPKLHNLNDSQLAKDLGVDFILRLGVLRRVGKIRIHSQLVDARSGTLLWAEKFDAGIDQIFEIQDNLVEKISSFLPRKIQDAKLVSARRKPIQELEAYDWWLRGMDKLRKGDLNGDEEARELFEQALEKDPLFSRAYVGLSISHFNEWSCQHWELSELSECRAFQYATKAYELDPNDAQCHIVLSRVYLFRREYERAESHMNRALELNPNDADALVMIGAEQVFLGEADKGAETFERAIRLNPYFDPWYYAYGGFIKIMQRKFGEGIEMGLKAPLTTVWIDLAGFLSLAYAYQGNLEEAAIYRDIFLQAYKEKITKGKESQPGEAFEWLVLVNCFKESSDAEFYRKGLELAGFPLGNPDVGNGSTREKEFIPKDSDKQSTQSVFSRQNDLRRIVFAGSSLLLPEVKGFGDIEALLIRQGEEIHCTELMGAITELGESTEILDAKARQDYAARIRELQSELVDAEEGNDPVRAEKIREELDPLLDHLAKVVGIGGKSRRLAAPAERARSAVTWRIRSAIKKIEEADAGIGRHFSNTIRTGTFCSYCPENPVSWKN